jgi:SAM-dependent methyltransferase
LLTILRFVLIIVLVVWLFRQVRKPSGWLGRRIVQGMNVGHAKMTDWALQQVSVPKNAAILDVGCGGGWTVRKLAALASDGKVIGLDYSAASVAVSRETNAKEIEAGRAQIEHGSVQALPFPDSTFDIVTAVETHYYWPDLPANVSWRAPAVSLRRRDAAAPCSIFDRHRAPRAPDPSRIHRRRDQALVR